MARGVLSKKTLRLLSGLVPFHEHAITRVDRGITIDAKNFLTSCALYIRSGVLLPAAFATFLAKRLDEIALLENPWGKPLLKRGKGKGSSDIFDWRLHVAQQIHLLRTREGLTIEAAAIE